MESVRSSAHNPQTAPGRTRGLSRSATSLLYCPLVPIEPSSILLTDRVAVVTGGGSGIGRGIANGFRRCGAKVAIWERHADTAAAAGEEVGGLGLQVDVRDSGEVDAAL